VPLAREHDARELVLDRDLCRNDLSSRRRTLNGGTVALDEVLLVERLDLEPVTIVSTPRCGRRAVDARAVVAAARLKYCRTRRRGFALPT
jgi:hypothetical protein